MSDTLSTNDVFVCVLEGGGSLWLQGKTLLPESTVSRSEQLSTIQETLRLTQIGTKSFIPGMDEVAFKAWLSAVATEDKALEHLPAQQLAQTLTAADFLRDMALMQEVAAAQRPRILAISEQPPSEAHATLSIADAPAQARDAEVADADGGATAGPHSGKPPRSAVRHTPEPEPPAVCGSGATFFSPDGDGPLRWFKQLAAKLSEPVLWTLLREAVGSPKHIGDDDMCGWLLALPPPLMAFAARACSPCIDTRGAFHAQMSTARDAQRVAELVQQLHSQLRQVFIMLPHPPPPSEPQQCGALERLMAAVCSAPTLRTLHIVLRDTGIRPRYRAAVQCIVRHLPAASGLESLAIEVAQEETHDVMKEVDASSADRAARADAESDSDDSTSGADVEDPLEREISAALAGLPQLHTLKLVGLRGLEEAMGRMLPTRVRAMRTLRRLHVVNCISSNGKGEVIESLLRTPHLTNVRNGTTGALVTHGRSRRLDYSDAGVPSCKPYTTCSDTTTWRRAAPHAAHRRPGAQRGTAQRSVAGGSGEPDEGWDQLGYEVAVETVETDLAESLQGHIRGRQLRKLSVDGNVLSGDSGGRGGLQHGLRFPSAGYARELLSGQTHLTELFLGGSVQPQDDFEGHTLAAVLARLPSLRALGLRASGMPPAALDDADGMEWDELPDKVRTWFGSWAVVAERLLLARADHAVPLERLSLDLLHPLGRAAASVSEAAAAIYMDDVGSVLAAVGGLTTLTSLDFSVMPEAVDPGMLLEPLTESLSSLRQLNSLSLSIAWSSAAPAESFMRSLRQLSQLTELQLRLRSRKGAAMSGNTLAKVALGLEGAMAVGRGAAGDDVRCAGGSGEGLPTSPGMSALQVLRLGPLAKGFESAVQQVQRAGRHWKAAKGSSRLLGGVCVAAQHVEWLELVGELQQMVDSAGDRLYIVLG